jgi:hypothetical protein
MKLINIHVYVLLAILLLSACSNDSIIEPVVTDDTIEQERPLPEEEPEEEEQPPSENPNPIGLSAGNTTFLNKELVDTNYILVNDAGNNFVYLMSKNARVLHQWNLNGGNLGNDCYYLEDGRLLAMVESDDPKILLGGYGGKVQLLKADGTELWSFVHSTEDYIIHHDAELLPNGNILTMTWEKHTAEEALANGYKLDVDLFPDGLIEIDPTTNEIVWEWRLWDHMVQDHDETKANYGQIVANPQLVDINYNQREDGDISHANGIAYDPEKDIIYLSANFYSEVWVIDHSTTTEEAASHTGGQYNKGGDLIYRFGNPMAYKNTHGQRLFHNNHYPNLLEGADEGNMLIFSNGGDLMQSTVYELQLPSVFNLDPNLDNEPVVLWSFTDEELFSAKVSGAEKLPNGNILITEGDYGIWEVTQNKEVVWKFNAEGFFWRAYHFDKNAPEIIALGIE